MKVRNTTKYQFEFTRAFNEVPDNSSYSFQSQRRLDIYQRLYFEYIYTKSINGLALFWTLTYNDKCIPIYTIPQCPIRWYTHSYTDIRLVTNGILSKWLLRKYDCNLKYFCAPELGDGKGKRGKGNNPHYHFIFFIQPKSNKLPSSFEFASKIKEVWQGSSSYVPFKLAKYGCCQPGNNNGVINSTTALKYVSKYVIKDYATISQEKSIELAWREYLKDSFLTPSLVYRFYRYVLKSPDYPYIKNKSNFISFMLLDKYHNLRKIRTSISYKHFLLISHVCLNPDLHESCKYVYNLLYEYFMSNFYEELVISKIKQYRNLYGTKVRYSQGLGISGLQNVCDPDSNPHFVIPDKSNYLSIPISLYYKRKLFYDTFKDENNNTIYRLNERGINLYCKQLPNRIETYIDRLKTYISTLSTPVSYDYDLLRQYVIYKLVYEYRTYSNRDSLSLSSKFDINDILLDYRHFISYSIFMSDYSPVQFSKKLYDCKRVSFSSHPLFIDNISKFRELDNISCNVSQQLDDIKRADYLKRREIRSQLLRNKFNKK